MFGLRYLPGVTTLQLDAELCSGCGMCLNVCPHAVLASAGHGKVAITDRDACMECGACARNCSFGALSVQAGVGCAAAIIVGALRGTEPTCGCGDGEGMSCC
ncbi:MAG: 4Fe-4S dicluster domain-containing protein [Deltaproteobacteria bacterium]|nr:4Fe-4S dicluster domain-containing protein [Deltaproteobacteria bacterium]